MRDPLAAAEGAIDNFNAKGMALAKKMVGDFFTSLIRPMATIHEAITRSDLGERYFTFWNYYAGLAIIAFASVPWAMWDSFAKTKEFWRGLGNCGFSDRINFYLGCLWLFVFMICGRIQFGAIRKRYKEQTLWHSYSNGWSKADAAMKPETQCVWLMIIGGILAWRGIYTVGALLVASAYVSLQIRVVAEARLYNQVLDRIDARIEQEELEKAVVERASPRDTHGFAAPLRAGLPRKHRETFVQSMQPRRPRIASEASVAA